MLVRVLSTSSLLDRSHLRSAAAPASPALRRSDQSAAALASAMPSAALRAKIVQVMTASISPLDCLRAIKAFRGCAESAFACSRPFKLS
jgi:hypothetical protein